MRMTLGPLSSDVNIAMALGIWPGCVNHACWPEEVVISGVRR